jgi:hypothetical protein
LSNNNAKTSGAMAEEFAKHNTNIERILTNVSDVGGGKEAAKKLIEEIKA